MSAKLKRTVSDAKKFLSRNRGISLSCRLEAEARECYDEPSQSDHTRTQKSSGANKTHFAIVPHKHGPVTRVDRAAAKTALLDAHFGGVCLPGLTESGALTRG
jgi:hypothetical protein